jgi:hypothetical protein
MSGRRDLKPVETLPSDVADRREKDADHATEGDAEQREVSASTPLDTHAAIRTAPKLAIDSNDIERAHALLDLLRAKPLHSSVVKSRDQAALPLIVQPWDGGSRSGDVRMTCAHPQ